MSTCASVKRETLAEKENKFFSLKTINARSIMLQVVSAAGNIKFVNFHGNIPSRGMNEGNFPIKEFVRHEQLENLILAFCLYIRN